jgi:ABC-type Fe3+ transport system substrate-binding protein
LPDPLQKRTTYSALLAKQPRHPAEARALLDYLVSPAGRAAFAAAGFAAPKE